MLGLAIEPRAPRRRAAPRRHPAQAHRRGPLRTHRASRLGERDRALRHGRVSPARAAGAHERALRGAGEDASAEHSLPRDRSRAPRKGTAGTRSRPVAPGSLARCSCASKRWAAARGSSSSMTSSAERSRVSSFRRSRRVCARCSPRGRSRAFRSRTCASRCTTASTTRWIPRRSRSCPPGARPSWTRCRRRPRSCSSRSCAWRSPRPPAPSVTSPATLPPSAPASTATTHCPGQRATLMAFVPLAEISEYQSRLKSLTGGQGAYIDGAQPLRPGAAAQAAGTRPGVAAAGRGRLRRRLRRPSHLTKLALVITPPGL